MHSLENPPIDVPQEPPPFDQPQTEVPPEEFKIGGFDKGTPAIMREPSLYVSIAIIFVATFVSFNKTPVVFWSSFIAISVIAVIFFAVAERSLFKTSDTFNRFAIPFEGVFVITFGSVLPGLGLLAYGIYALATSHGADLLEETAKMALLLVVPLFNFAVWSALRRGYLVRPRLTGLMNGLALGLSASWTIIWLSSAFLLHGASSCKLGWMLLLCSSPFMLFAAAGLCLDLYHKTETNIRRITATFVTLGVLLSLLFVLTPMARMFWVQSLLSEAENGSSSDASNILSTLRNVTTDADLRPSNSPVSGFALAEMLVPNRGLGSDISYERDLYFRITGKPYWGADNTAESASQQQSVMNPIIGGKVAGLSLAKSQISGVLDSLTLSSSIDWTMTFRNFSSSEQEARAEIQLPKGAAVSRVTLWVNGIPQEGVTAATPKVQAAYNDTTSARRDPLLVTMPAPDKVLIRCYPVPVDGGDMKIRLGFKLPLETTDGAHCSLQLPYLLDTNFAQPKRNRVSLDLNDKPVSNIAGLVAMKNEQGYMLNGILKVAEQGKALAPIVIQRSSRLKQFATPDANSKYNQYIIEQIREITAFAPKHLFVVIDSSASLQSRADEIKDALANLPKATEPTIYFTPAPDMENGKISEVTPKTMQQALAAITPAAFIGGQTTGPQLQDALESAAEKAGSAVLWIHGPQPLTQNPEQFSALDLVHGVCLYDLQIEPGPVSVIQALQTEDASNMISYVSLHHDSTVKDVQQLVSDGQKGTKKLSMVTKLTTKLPDMTIIDDKAISARITAIWAKGTTSLLIANGQQEQAQKLATDYRIVTPVTGTVVLQTEKDYRHHDLIPSDYKDQSLRMEGAPSSGLVGAAVYPRFGQSNEVGMMSDLGYDTARDIVRILTAISLLISIVVAAMFLRSQKATEGKAIAKAVCLVLGVPVTIHLLGTFFINNFGGLGGGL
ncbi:MAG TPA: VIT domain-containing protein [Planktothrix sp.]|jgi:hypothetical protein